MQMIARFATSPPVHDAEIEAQRRRNLQERMRPALMGTPGFRGGMWLKRPDGTVHSITLWDSEDAMHAAERSVNARPMQEGQRADALPGPQQGQVVEVAEVLDFIAGPEVQHG